MRDVRETARRVLSVLDSIECYGHVGLHREGAGTPEGSKRLVLGAHGCCVATVDNHDYFEPILELVNMKHELGKLLTALVADDELVKKTQTLVNMQSWLEKLWSNADDVELDAKGLKRRISIMQDELRELVRRADEDAEA